MCERAPRRAALESSTSRACSVTEAPCLTVLEARVGSEAVGRGAAGPDRGSVPGHLRGSWTVAVSASPQPPPSTSGCVPSPCCPRSLSWWQHGHPGEDTVSAPGHPVSCPGSKVCSVWTVRDTAQPPALAAFLREAALHPDDSLLPTRATRSVTRRWPLCWPRGRRRRRPRPSRSFLLLGSGSITVLMCVCACDWVDGAQRRWHGFWTWCEKPGQPAAVVLGEPGISAGRPGPGHY